MKKITLLLALVALSFQSKAQIAPGSVAPDFTVTDINGNTHHLADYIAAGKTVIMDISATWCGPCWNFHNSKALEDIYNSYGQGGSSEVVVLFVEGDGTTGEDDLYGQTPASRGNWVEHTPYPILDASSISDLYQITYFPTLFRICPDGLVSEISAGTASSIRTSINANCGTLTGTQNNVGSLENTNSFCSANGNAVAKIRNYGENSITAATLNLKEDGNVVATKNFSGLMPRFTTRTVTFDTYAYNPDADYSVEVVSANSATPFNANITSAEMGVSIAVQAPTDVVVKIYTDNYPTEISWNIKNSAGTIVANGGPYTGNANGGGADANTVKTHNVSLPSNECYTINLLDSYGDGWTYGATQHGVEVYDNSNNAIYSYLSGNFTSSLPLSNALTTTALANETFEATTLRVFPNPTSGMININTEETVTVNIIDVTGKVILTANNVTKDKNIDLSGFQKGMYLAKIVSANGTTTEKIILK
ncbi:T9SS type A sorting domain-containing protein [Flavobacterium sp. CYK-4]|uniref:T9SS type A sorting domain-containing protein n=1 Tax=Flavobacterium lotistagni TaxID=2709660 RepID=UPI00140BE547|nr:T9SS type A sorting domain-containing protein [Flavobacterium lotistagni]NHM05947.1 T9SS type A sorting domain-containing protein [Flavobacterium lotistagni]